MNLPVANWRRPSAGDRTYQRRLRRRTLFFEPLEARRMLTDWYVASGPEDPHEDGTPEHPFNQIQEAATAAGSGDTVLVLPGTYTGPGNRDITTAGKSLTFRSTGGTAATTLDAQGTAGENHRSFLIEGGAVTLDGLTLTGGYAGEGGAVWSRSAALTVLHSVLTANASSGWGAALYVVRGGAVRLEESTFSQNTAAGHGGAVMVENSPRVELTGCTFTDNTAQADGGAVRTYNVGTLVLTDSTWTGNHAGWSGGAIWAGLGSQLTFAGTNTLAQNSADRVGGAVALTNISTVAVGGSATFTGNISGGHGGAVYLDYCVTAGFTAAAFQDNTSPADGGAIFASAGGTVSLADSTFDGNHAGWGGAVEAYYVRHVQITGSSLRGNVASGSGGGLRLVQCVGSQVTGTRFEQNSAQGNGGAIESDQNQHIRLVDNTFRANRSENGSAGAVMLSNLGQGEVLGTNRFVDNYARYDAGAVFLQYCGSVIFDGAIVTGNNAGRHVGAIEVVNQSRVLMTGCTISGNTAQSSHAAVIVQGKSSGRISGSTIADNHAGDYGGALDVYDSTVTLEDNLIQNNSSGGLAGAVCVRAGANVTLRRNRVLNNSSGSHGGGVYVEGVSTVTLADNWLEGNSAGGEGGGIAIYTSRATIDHNVIYNNTSQNGSGGGISCYYTNARITGNLVWQNRATNALGGGLFCNYASPLLAGNVFYNNSAGGGSGSAVAIQACSPSFVNNVIVVRPGSPHANPASAQIRAWWSSYPLVVNTVIWGVGASIASDTGANVCYSDTWDNFAGGTGNLSADPQFVNADNPLGDDGVWGTPDDGLRLAASSPCVDAGDPAFVDSDGTRSDLGAYGQALTQIQRTDWHVSAANTVGPWLGDAASPFRWIWQALLAAHRGDTIDVGAGTYRESLPVSTDYLAIRGAGAQSTILDVEYRAAAFDIVHAQGVEISGWTITHGAAAHAGGAIRCRYSQLYLHDNIIRDSTAGNCWYGAGLWVAANSEAHVENNQFLSNVARTHGGAIYWEAGCTGTLIGNDFYDNHANNYGGALLMAGSPVVRENLFRYNSADWGGAVVNLGAAEFVHATCVLNSAITRGGGLYNWGSAASIRNSIFWDNTAPADAELGTNTGTTLTVTYSDIDGTGVWPGTGNLNADPLFANPAAVDPQVADYHLQSQYGRWDPQAAGGAGDWVFDAATSPAIDAGDPADGVGVEPAPNGQRVNLGAYGGTRQASKSPSPGLPSGEQPPPSMRGGPTLDLYVDDDASHDPGPGNPSVSDPAEDGSEAHPFDTLQEALNAAATGATIHVSPGLYRGVGNRDLDTRGKTLTMQSTGGAALTTLDAQGTSSENHRVFQSINGGMMTLDGLTLTGGYSGNGGAVWSSSASLSVLNSVVTGNYSSGWGGAIYAYYGGVIDVQETTFDQNTAAGHGGAVAAENCITVQIADSVFTANTARADGGAVRAYNAGSITLTDNTWTGNHADRDGGAVWAGLTPQFAVGGDSEFTNNTANRVGGAVALSNLDSASFTGLPEFSTNTANGHGGAVYVEHCSSASFTTATLAGNTSHQNGGAVQAYYTDTLSFTGTTLTGNHADGNGGAINATAVHEVQLAGDTLTGNVADGSGGGLRLYTCVRSLVNGTRFDQNAATANGGALDSDQNQLIRLVDGTFSGNRSENGVGGAVMLSNLGQGDVTGDNRFLDNYARWDAGAIYVQYAGDVTIDGATISGNTADRYAGGILVRFAQFTLSGSALSNNTGKYWIGGLHVTEQTISTIRGNVIENNKTGNGGGGGGIDVYNSRATIEDNTVQGNVANGNGGGISLRAGAVATISGNRLLKNVCETGIGGGIYAESSTVQILENLIRENVSSQVAGGYGGGVHAYNCPASVMAGNQVIGNSGDGIVVNRTAGARLEDNEVMGNTLAGIALLDAFTTGVTLSRNRTYGNGGPGLDLNRDGVTVNDPDDGDTGPNLLLNNPVLSLGSGAASGFVRVQGTAGPGQTVEVFRAEGTADYGEASAYLGSTIADAAGGFFLDVPDTNFWVTATATDAAGNTSELSQILQTGTGTVYVVNTLACNTLVDGWLSLCEAVHAANDDNPVGDAPAGHGADIIRFDPVLTGGTILLEGVDLPVAPSRLSPGTLPDITILGLGTDKLAVAPGPNTVQTRHFEVNPGASLAISALTLTNGYAGEGAMGGSIYCEGTLQLTDVVLSANRAGQDGGAIAATATSPAVTLTDCQLVNNRAVGNGGGIYQAGGTLTITGGLLNLNKATHGGGVYASGAGQVLVTGGTFTRNEASGTGGGIRTAKELAVSDSMFEENKASVFGGGVYTLARLTVTGGAFIENQSAYGGGIFISGGPASLTNVSLDQNLATYSGGAVYASSTSLVAQQDSRFTDNIAGRDGGAIYLTLAGLMVDDCEFSGNRADWNGGALWHSRSAVAVSQSTFTGNTAAWSGGAVYGASPPGNLLIDGSLFVGNVATTGDGGGVWNSGPGTVVTSTFRTNTSGGNGGAVYLAEDDYAFSIAQCLLEQNTAGSDGSGSGGALWSNQRRVEIVATTIRQNTAANNGGGIAVAEGLALLIDSLVATNTATGGSGGGLFVDASAELNFTNSTSSGNAAQQAGGGFYFNGVTNRVWLVHATVTNNRADAAGTSGQAGGGLSTSSAQILVQNSILAGNFRGAGTTASDVDGTLDPASSHNLIGSDPHLDPLADNGSCVEIGAPLDVDPTYATRLVNQTHALLAGSPAVDAGDNALALAPSGEPLWYDQRGWEFDRLVGLYVDLGAYEYQQPGGQILGRKWFDLDQDGSPDDAWGLSIVTNGGFEEGNLPGVTTLAQGSSALPGWIVMSGSVDSVASPNWTPAEGSHSIDLNGAQCGALAQTLITEPGRRYHVKFAMAGNPDQTLKSLRVSAAGESQVFTFDTAGHGVTSMGWETKTFEFVAQSRRTTLVFQSLNTQTPTTGPAIDNVVVQPFGRDDVRIYLDQNGSGAFEAGEPLTFLRSDDPNTAGVDETGTYRFTGLPLGDYTVRETLAAGFEQIAPSAPGSYAVTIVGTEVHANLDFGNRWMGEIHGTKFIDANNNGIRDRNPLPATSPTVLMVLDVSNTASRYAGFSIPDQNGDGATNQVLDAEIYTMLTLRQELINLGWGATAKVRVEVFASDAVLLDMDPAAAGVQVETTPDADTDNDEVSDLEEVLRALRKVPSGTVSGKSDYRAALESAVAALTTTPPPGPTVLYFTSDGLSNNPWTLDEQLDQLDALGVSRIAWGFGDLCDLAGLRRIDPLAQQLTSADQIVEKATERSRRGVGDGRWLELGLAGVTIYLDANGNGSLDPTDTSTLTLANDPATPDVDETGWYAFTGLPIGNYVVREVVPTGYTQTAPKNPDYHRVDLRTGPIATGYDFGNLGGEPCGIRGHKGLDADRDGEFEDGEPFQAGVTVFLDYNPNGQKDAGEPTAVTDAAGAFQFTNLAPGDYWVCEIVPPGFVQVAPSGGQCVAVHLDQGEIWDNLLFVNQDQRGWIGGFKWLDLDGSGAHETGEPGLAGVRVYLDVNNNGTWDSGNAAELSVLTQQDDPATTEVDETGQWKIANVVSGTYTVREVCPFGYTCSPAAGHSVTVPPLGAIEGLLFLNAPILPLIIGWKYEDLNQNGRRDPNMPRGSQPHVVLTVDKSGSTQNPFAGDPPGDVNGDGSADLLDGELALLIAAHQSLIDNGWADKALISVVAFTNVGFQLDMDPSTAGTQLTTKARADQDSDGIPDVVEVLRSIRRETDPNSDRTDYAVALQTVYNTLQAAGTPTGNGNVWFVSDGGANYPNNYDAKVQQLRNAQVDLCVFGAGQNAILYTLQKIDPDAVLYTDPHEFPPDGYPRPVAPAGGGSGPPASGSADGFWAEPGLPGIIVYIDDDNNGLLDWTDGDGDGQWDPREGERWGLSEYDNPATPDLDETGRYCFDDLQPDSYIIREILPDGWQGVPLRTYLVDPSLRAYFLFGGDTLDAISGVEAVNNGATETNDRFARSEQAYSFDGHQWLTANLANLPLGGNPRTLSLWARSADGQTEGAYEHVANWGAASYNQAFGLMDTPSGQWAGYMHGGSDVGTSVNIDTNWHHLVITYDGATASVFVDGQLRGSGSRTLATAAGSLLIAMRPDLADGSGFDGTVDDVRIYDRALTSNEVTALYAWEDTRAVVDEGAYIVRVDYGDVVTDVNFGDIVNDPGTLIVTRFMPAETGFVARFSRDLDSSVLNLYDSAAHTLGAADVTVTGATVGPIRGSLVVSADQRRITFVQTGGVLEPDSYTVTLYSGTTRFREPTGETLDGNADGTRGDDYRTTFTVSAQPAGTVTVSLPDIARGAGQPVHVPAAASGLPIRLDNAAGVTSLAVDLVYDGRLLEITAAGLAAGLPGDWSVEPLDTSTPGVAKIRASGTTPLSGTNVEVVRLTAAVPDDASYGAVQAIRLENVSLNGGTIAAVGDVAFHKAAYLGDADGSGIHSSADAFLTVQAALGLASGFSAHAWTDPRIVGDADGSGVLSAADAFLIVQEGLDLSEPFVPDNPHISVSPAGGGVDPQFRIDANLPASAGGLVAVPVQLGIDPAATNVGALDFDLFFDASRLTIQVPGGVLAGADTTGWAMSAMLVAPGQLRVGMISSGGQPLSPGLREIARLQFCVEAGESSRTGWQHVRDGLPTRSTLLPPITDVLDGSETHPTWLDIEPVDPRAGGYVWTAVDGSVAIEPRERLFADLGREWWPLEEAVRDLTDVFVP